eukprot:3784077-Amphidinium_carterae.1
MGEPCHNYDFNIILELFYNFSASPCLQLAVASGLSVYPPDLPCTHVPFTQHCHRPLSHRGYVSTQVLCPVCSSHALDPVGACGCFCLYLLLGYWTRLRVGIPPCPVRPTCHAALHLTVCHHFPCPPSHRHSYLVWVTLCVFACRVLEIGVACSPSPGSTSTT